MYPIRILISLGLTLSLSSHPGVPSALFVSGFRPNIGRHCSCPPRMLRALFNYHVKDIHVYDNTPHYVSIYSLLSFVITIIFWERMLENAVHFQQTKWLCILFLVKFVINRNCTNLCNWDTGEQAKPRKQQKFSINPSYKSSASRQKGGEEHLFYLGWTLNTSNFYCKQNII
jgi:hypothetical protein